MTHFLIGFYKGMAKMGAVLVAGPSGAYRGAVNAIRNEWRQIDQWPR
jgi:hypothetical protein